MKKISAFILIVFYAAFSIGGVGGFEFADAYSGSVEKGEVTSLAKHSEKDGDLFTIYKVVKHGSAVVKGKNSRFNQAFLEPRNDINVYHSFLPLQLSGTIHPHIEHTPLFLMNRIQRI